MSKRDYSRIFTDLFPRHLNRAVKIVQKEVIASTKATKYHLLLSMVLLNIILAVALFMTYDHVLQLEQQQEEVKLRLQYWEDVVGKHPNYPDAYYNAAVYSLRIEDRDRAAQYLEKALEYDPYFVKALELKRDIESKRR